MRYVNGPKYNVHEFWLRKKDKLGWIRPPAFADVKYDGEYCMADTRSHQLALINSYGKARVDGPIIDTLPKDSIVFGELYHGTGRMGALYDLLSNKLSNDLNMAVFDGMRIAGRDISGLTLMERREVLAQYIPQHIEHDGLPHMVDTYYCEDANDIESAFQEAMGNGYEGVVVKQVNSQLQFGASCTWVKLKYTATADLKVVCIDPSQERIECELPGAVKPLGVKVMNKIKQTLNVGDIVEIEHYGVLSGGGLRHPVFKRVREPNKRVSVDI